MIKLKFFIVRFVFFLFLSVNFLNSYSQSISIRNGKYTYNGKINKTDSLGQRQGTWVYGNGEGIIKVVGYINDTIEGTIKIFRLYDGKTLHQEQYLKGKLNGLYIDYNEYSEDKRAVKVQYYKNGRLHGTEKKFNNGKLWTVTDYKNGFKDGFIKTYYNSGKLWSIEKYEAGKSKGHFIYYYKNGNIEYEGDAQNLGPQKFYTKSGRLKKLRHYDSSGKYLKTEYYKRDGKLKKVKVEKKTLSEVTMQQTDKSSF